MKAVVMTAVKEPFTTREIPDPQPLQDKFVSAYMRLAYVERTRMEWRVACPSADCSWARAGWKHR
jgi:hypothetical protein